MLSVSGKFADKIAAKQQAAHQSKVSSHKKGASKKLASVVKGGVATKLQKQHAKTKTKLDQKANPDALARSKKKVKLGLKKLNLKSAGFGRYHKGKGQPITHWVVRSPKTGLYILADKELRAKILGKADKPAVKKTAKAPEKHVSKKPVAQPVAKKRGRKTNALKAHEARKEKLTSMHVARLDAKRAQRLAAKGKAHDTPMSKREQAARANSVKKLHSVLDKHFVNKTVKKPKV